MLVLIGIKMRNDEVYKEIKRKEKTALVDLRNLSVDWDKNEKH